MLVTNLTFVLTKMEREIYVNIPIPWTLTGYVLILNENVSDKDYEKNVSDNICQTFG